MPNPEALKVLRNEIETDLIAVRSLMEQLGEARRLLSQDAGQRNLAFVSYLVHGIYTGWESAFHRIATVFENQLDPSRWHAQLLLRMTLDLEGIRPAVIDADVRSHLQKLRSFRHFFRHSYGASLRLDEIELVLDAYDAAAPRMEECFKQFLGIVEQIADQAEEGQS